MKYPAHERGGAVVQVGWLSMSGGTLGYFINLACARQSLEKGEEMT